MSVVRGQKHGSTLPLSAASEVSFDFLDLKLKPKDDSCLCCWKEFQDSQLQWRRSGNIVQSYSNVDLRIKVKPQVGS